MSLFLVVLCTCALLEKVNGWIFFYLKTGTIKKIYFHNKLKSVPINKKILLIKKSKCQSFHNSSSPIKFPCHVRHPPIQTWHKMFSEPCHHITKCSTNHVATSQNDQRAMWPHHKMFNEPCGHITKCSTSHVATSQNP